MVISFENAKKIVYMEEYFDSLSSLRMWLIKEHYELLCDWLDYREECRVNYNLEKTEENKEELKRVIEKVRWHKAIQRLLEGTKDFSKSELSRWNTKRAIYMKEEYGIACRRFKKWNTQVGHYMMKSF